MFLLEFHSLQLVVGLGQVMLVLHLTYCFCSQSCLIDFYSLSHHDQVFYLSKFDVSESFACPDMILNVYLKFIFISEQLNLVKGHYHLSGGLD